MQLKKNIKLGKIELNKILFYLSIFIFFSLNSYAAQKNYNLEGNFVEKTGIGHIIWLMN